MLISKKICYSLLSVLCFFADGGISAQTVQVFDTLKTKVYFLGGSSELDYDYHDNGASLFSFMEQVISLTGDSYTKSNAVQFFAGASLDMFMQDEMLLCHARNESVRSIFDRYVQSDSIEIMMYSVGLNWNALLEYVRSRDVPYRGEVEKIARYPLRKLSMGDTLAYSSVFELKVLDGGAVWEELKKECFDDLNTVEMWCISERSVPSATVEETPLPPENTPQPAISSTSGRQESFSMSLRTNLLFDVALVPSLGIEFYLGQGFSIGGQWGYSDWTTGNNRIYKYCGGDIDVKWWFGRKHPVRPLTGHHIGVYGQMASFDFGTGTNRFSSAQWFWAAGAEYGYSIPFKKVPLAIDFSIGLGYGCGVIDMWYIRTAENGDSDYIWNNTSNEQYVGPTKAEISLIWLIGGKADKNDK